MSNESDFQGVPPDRNEVSNATAKAPWQPIDAVQRRVLGVLIEKSKTTPNAYPLTLNAIVTGANQKSNRFPFMQLTDESADEALYQLRQIGAVVEMQGGGRVPKYRHQGYDWLGVNKREISVMAELLLRGAQTEGELRTRASRMDRIDTLDELREILEALKQRGLVIPIKSEGRGHVVTHGLYLQRELEKVRTQYSSVSAQGTVSPEDDDADDDGAPVAVSPRVVSAVSEDTDSLRMQIEQLNTYVAELREICESLSDELRQTRDEVARIKEDLGL